MKGSTIIIVIGAMIFFFAHPDMSSFSKSKKLRISRNHESAKVQEIYHMKIPHALKTEAFRRAFDSEYKLYDPVHWIDNI